MAQVFVALLHTGRPRLSVWYLSLVQFRLLLEDHSLSLSTFKYRESIKHFRKKLISYPKDEQNKVEVQTLRLSGAVTLERLVSLPFSLYPQVMFKAHHHCSQVTDPQSPKTLPWPFFRLRTTEKQAPGGQS